jgi:uncharacterized repeat protein (TIGR04076 family)
MANCKITVIERSFRKEYVEQYVEDERKKTLGPCEVFTEGQTFIVDAASASMPQGFCPWAWNDIYKVLVAYFANGSFDMWNQGGNKILACCSDGTRPVYLEIEKMEQ